MASLSQIKKLENRYPFSEEELEILLRCHESLLDTKNEDSFIMKLAMCSPYSYFFLPGDEMRRRVDFCQNQILPMGFSNELRAAIAADAFVEYANAGEEKQLERFLEGVANTGRRGRREVIHVLHEVFSGYGSAEELVDLCFRLGVAAEVLVAPNLDEAKVLQRLEHNPPSQGLVRSLEEAAGGCEEITRRVLEEWAESTMPLMPSTLSVFVHALLFHGHPYPESWAPYVRPQLYHSSDIFRNSDSSILFTLGCTSHLLGGKWHRLYSFESEGRSFNRIEHSLFGYDGPTLVIIQTETDAILGALAAEPWKDSPEFAGGNSDGFVFQIEPKLGVFLPVGREKHYQYCNSETRIPFANNGLPHGMGFGGDIDHPRLFIPESLEEGSANYLDTTYQVGDLLPEEALEKFRIKYLEVWGVGGDKVTQEALRVQAEYRERTESTLLKARKVTDKTQFVKDLSSGLYETNLYQHREQTRGRHEFAVDNEHGGYKVDPE